MTSVREGEGILHVVRPGALTTVQDAGRPGWAHLGVGRAGVLDAPAARLANRLAG
ncbi:allophanate hydrolase subunit 2 family protein, partial [Streptomyces fulvissimus]|nr:allophanate hydrolase subunit 2 family protein [Streptomyces microflavus]